MSPGNGGKAHRDRGRRTGFGGFGEYKAIGERNCIKLADSVDPKYALGEP